MENLKFDIITTGMVLEGYTTEDVRLNIIRRFKIDKTLANRFICGKPLTFKKNLSEEQSQFYANLLFQLGLKIKIHQVRKAIKNSGSHLRLVSKNEGQHVHNNEAEYITCFHCGTRQIREKVCFKCKGSLAHSEKVKNVRPKMKRTSPTTQKYSGMNFVIGILALISIGIYFNI